MCALGVQTNFSPSKDERLLAFYEGVRRHRSLSMSPRRRSSFCTAATELPTFSTAAPTSSDCTFQCLDQCFLAARRDGGLAFPTLTVASIWQTFFSDVETRHRQAIWFQPVGAMMLSCPDDHFPISLDKQTFSATTMSNPTGASSPLRFAGLLPHRFKK